METNTATATAETFSPSDEQKAIFAEVEAFVNETREKRGITDQSVRALEAYAKENLSGTTKGEEVNPNHTKRVNLASYLLQVPTESIQATRATPQAIGKLMVAMLFNTDSEQIRESYSELLKSEKTVEPSDSETALSQVFGQKLEISKKVKNLETDDWKNIQSASHASFQTVLKFLSPVDEKGKVIKEMAFPQGAENFLSYLIGASGGRTDEFAITDKMIAESSGMSESSIKRHRKALEEWMHKTGKGIVSIKQSEKAPTRYRVILLDYTTAVIEQMFSSGQTSSEALLAVAGAAGKLLSGQKLIGVGEKESELAQNLSNSLKGIVDSLPEPVIETASNLDARAVQAMEKKLKKLTGLAEEVRTLASAAEHAEAETQAGTIASELNAIIEAKDFGNVNTDELAERLDKVRAEVSNVTASDLDRATGRMEAEQTANGTISDETFREYGDAFAATVSGEDAEAVINRELGNIRKSLFIIASLSIAHGVKVNILEELNGYLAGAGFTAPEQTPDAPETTEETEEL